MNLSQQLLMNMITMVLSVYAMLSIRDGLKSFPLA